MIRVHDLHKNFGKLVVLNGITEHIEKGEKIVVIGPSGSGKSTFLRCLNLLEQPTSGEIYVDDELITQKKFNVNNTEFYADLAEAFLCDKDADDDKLVRYYECIVE